MKRILTWGSHTVVNKYFRKIGLLAKMMGEVEHPFHGRMAVYSLTASDFKKLCNDPTEWKDAAWRFAAGSVLGRPDQEFVVRGKKLMCWNESEPSDEEEVEFPEFDDVLAYLEWQVGVTTERNICACLVDLAKANKLSLEELLTTFVKPMAA
jgi:hypothetical protein